MVQENNDNFFPDLPMYPPTDGEILKGFPKLKDNKAAGYDELSNKEMKYGDQVSVSLLRPIYGKVWNTESVPKDWLCGVITTIWKKGDLSLCSNNRGITLNAVACKLHQIIVLNRLSEGIEKLIRENQCGFRKGRSCSDQLFTLRVVIDNALEHNLPLKINFIDFKAAFDSVDREHIWTTLEHYGLPEKYVRPVF